MKKIIFLTGATTLVTILSACSPIDSLKPFDQKQAAKLFEENYTPKPAQQMIKLNLPQKRAWKKIDLSAIKKGSPVMLIPVNENAEKWNESISTKISAYTADPDMSASKFAGAEINRAAQNCKQIGSKFLATNTQSVVYRLDLIGCKYGNDRVEISKAFNGNDAVYAVRYIALNGRVDANEISKMSHVIETAQLIRNPKYHR